MDTALLILGGLLVVMGILGSVLPVLPGPPLAWIGILIVHFTDEVSFSNQFLLITAAVMLLVTILDYFIPIWGTKRFGGSKSGATGATIGMVAGIFLFPPVGMVLLPFVGAFLGELIFNKQKWNSALKSATGSFVGFLLSTGLKLIFCGVMGYYYVVKVAEVWN